MLGGFVSLVDVVLHCKSMFVVLSWGCSCWCSYSPARHPPYNCFTSRPSSLGGRSVRPPTWRTWWFSIQTTSDLARVPSDSLPHLRLSIQGLYSARCGGGVHLRPPIAQASMHASKATLTRTGFEFLWMWFDEPVWLTSNAVDAAVVVVV